MGVLSPVSGEEEDEMSHRKISRILAAGALVALLALPGTARADTGAGDPAGAWQWLVNLWEELWSPGEGQEGGAAGTQSDAGPGFDPNGG
jgi:hypothetical protein